jgi:archaemetzincin
MDPPVITLFSFGYFEKGLLEKVSEAVRQEFACSVMQKDAHVDLSEFFDAGRRQYNGDKLLKEVDSMIVPGSSKLMGLFQVDLFIPILTYIFGQAHLGGRSGIASLYRLNNERYGMNKDEEVLTERFRKEVIHELGHTFGLLHCHTPGCVMTMSTYVEDIDQKESQLCLKCKAALEIGFLNPNMD